MGCEYLPFSHFSCYFLLSAALVGAEAERGKWMKCAGSKLDADML